MVRGRKDELGEALRLIVGRNVREARTQAGYSQRELCALVGMSQAYLSQVESGTWNIAIDNIARIAIACNVPAYRLLHPTFGRRKTRTKID